uniref:Uncharacterized protein n=1 Tax=Ceratitis capitata TaxID=7213 RepID=W8BS67_CERCA
MVNIEGCCDRELGRDANQPNASGRAALRKAIKRAAKAQQRLNETIYQAQACGHSSSSSSSESETEHEVNRRGRGRNTHQGFSMRSHPYQHCPRMGGHGLRGAHGPRASMRGFPQGRHTLGFPGMMPHMGMGMGMHPHSHPHHGMQHHHHHHHPHHHHHSHGHFGHMPSFPGHAGPFGRGGRGHHEHGPGAGPFGRHFPHFEGMGHASGHRERAHSFPGF